MSEVCDIMYKFKMIKNKDLKCKLNSTSIKFILYVLKPPKCWTLINNKILIYKNETMNQVVFTNNQTILSIQPLCGLWKLLYENICTYYVFA